ncbi:MAG: hypothetical protein AB7G23_10070 [Vicinamibacterales bacterium]
MTQQESTTSMKLLFFGRHWSYFRNFESVIEELAARGHGVHLVVDREESMGGQQMIERLVARFPDRLSMGHAPSRALGARADLARRVRLGLDYLRFLEPRYADTPHLGDRARERAPRSVVVLADLPGLRTGPGRRLLGAILRSVERALPPGRDIEDFIRAQSPDAVLITPLVDLGSPQLDYFAAAKALGLRTMLPVGSWDHLSSKALLRAYPDAVLVWNDVQRREAVEMHGVPADRVVVTGAQCYDQWWHRQPARSRAAFCARVGLRPDQPFLLYVCSSLFRGTASEAAFVEQWVEAVRSAPDPALRDISILVRPHPARLDEWKGVDLSGYRHIAFWGAHPVDAEAKDDYFDSLYYSAAVVGLNTSAFLEASVVGKPVHTVLVPEISAHNQEGTLHFHYLLTVGGGLLRAARSLDEHVQLLAASLAGDGGGDPKAAGFAGAFIRPFGPDVAATPRFVDAVERAAAAPAPAREGLGLSGWLGGLLLYPILAGLSLRLRTQLWRKYTRNRFRKEYKTRRKKFLVDLKQFAVKRLGMKQRTPPPPPSASALTPKLGRHRDPAKRLAGWNLPEAKEVRELVTMLGRSGKPIIVGPWLSETGFELLYWIPFLAWAKAYGHLDPEQIVIVSRGGAAPWYSHISTQYEDILSFYSPDEFRTKNDARIVEQHGRMKHLDVSSFDREIIAKVTAKRGLGGVTLLHPSEMYRLFEHFWYQRAPVTLVEAFTAFSTLPPLDPFPFRDQLPERYVAAKFYGNTALPDTPENRAFIASFLTELAQHIDVVLLNTGHRFDDHSDFPSELKGRFHSIEHLMTPENNLTVQTQVIRGAQAFVGTYGGFSYMSPLSGVDTLAFYSHATGFRFDHLEVAKRVFSGLRCGSFVELDVRAVNLMKLGFGGAEAAARALAGSRR